MAGIKRRVEAGEDHGGKRTKVKDALKSSKSAKNGAPASTPKSKSKKEVKSTKVEKKNKKKVVESESEEESEDDEFDSSMGESEISEDEADHKDGDVDMGDASDSEETKENGDKNAVAKSTIPSMISSDAGDVYADFSLHFRWKFLTRITRQAEGFAAGAQGREAECRLDRSVQEALGTIAPQVPCTQGRAEEACYGTL